MTASEIERWLAAKVAAALNTTVEHVDHSRRFASQGIDSLALFTITGELAEWLGRDLPALVAWEHPTIEALARHLSEDERNVEVELPPEVPRDGPLPLSFSQERLCRYGVLGDAGDRNFRLECWVLTGDLDVRALKAALSEIVRRHEILRTTFSLVNGVPCQTIHPPSPVDLPLLDLTRAADPVQEALHLMAERARLPMNLGRGPLVRPMLARLSSREHRIVIAMHHLLFDAASLDVFYDELTACYRAFRDRAPAPALEPPLQVADFAAWQRDRLRPGGPEYQALLGWWMDHWAGPMPPPLALPFARTPGQKGPPGENPSLEWVIPAGLVDRIRELARRTATTPFAVLLGAFEALLCRLTGQETVTIGTYVSDRSRVAAGRSMGFFINLLALRADLTGEPTWLDLLHRVQEEWQQASTHRELPFEEFASELSRAGRRAPPIEVIFQQVRSARPVTLAGLEARRWALRMLPAFWGLTVQIVEDPAGPKVRLDCDVAKYDPAGLADMIREYEALLEAAVADPGSLVRPAAAQPEPSAAAEGTALFGT